jgi:DNA-binding ferritin-like protein
MDNQNKVNEIVKFFFTLQLLVKQYHWATTSFARHKASDNLLEKLDDNIDKFVEVFIGRYGVKPVITSLKMDQIYLSDDGNMKLLLQARSYLESLSNEIKDSELLNIRDEIVADLNQTIYLYNLK